MKRIHIPIYGGFLHLCGTALEFTEATTRAIEAQGLIPGEPSAVAACGLTDSMIVDGVVRVYVWAEHGNTAARCHEAVHCAQEIAEHLGMDPLRDREAFAYLAQWFFERIGS